MAYRRNRPINLPAPYLKRVWLDTSRVGDPAAYPFCLPFLQRDFELDFEHAITIIVGENGTGKSTLLEGIAVLAGYDEAGGGKGYMPVDHSQAIETMGGRLSQALRASWLPKITNGWFFRAESFFSVARYLDRAAMEDPYVVAATRLPVAFARGRLPAFLRGALPAAGHLHFRRAGVRFVAVAANRVSQAAAAHGAVGHMPGDHGHPFADADGLSRGAAPAAVEVRA
jgi:predicted ATPase